MHVHYWTILQKIGANFRHYLKCTQHSIRHPQMAHRRSLSLLIPSTPAAILVLLFILIVLQFLSLLPFILSLVLNCSFLPYQAAALSALLQSSTIAPLCRYHHSLPGTSSIWTAWMVPWPAPLVGLRQAALLPWSDINPWVPHWCSNQAGTDGLGACLRRLSLWRNPAGKQR